MNPKTGEVSDTPVGMMDVYQEFSELSEKFKIMKFKSKVRSLREGRAQLLHSPKMRQKTKNFNRRSFSFHCRKSRSTTPLKFPTCPVSASTWKSDIL